MTWIQLRFLLSMTVWVSMLFAGSLSCQAATAQDSSKATDNQDVEPLPPRSLAVVSSISWWSHDATGYHPAIMLRFENVSGKDLSGAGIQFQCRFMDVRNGQVTVARVKDARWDPLWPNQAQTITLRGPLPYELPINQYEWPSIECKVMCRVGDVDDSGTQDLILCRLQQVTMTDEQASESLLKHYAPPAAEQEARRRRRAQDHGSVATPAVPLSATQLSLNSTAKPKGTKHLDPVKETSKSSLARLMGASRLAGLGDEFFDFEQLYGVPDKGDREIHDKGWSWVHYSKPDSLSVYVATKALGSKADVIVVKIPAREIQQESQVVELAKAMAGKMRTQILDHPRKSVKYLPNGGRFLITTMDAPGYRFFYVNPRGPSNEDNNYLFVVSRLTGDLRSMMPELIRKSTMMRFLGSLLGDSEQN